MSDPFTPEERANMMASLVARGISARRADELIAKAAKRRREEEARDEAWEGAERAR